MNPHNQRWDSVTLKTGLMVFVMLIQLDNGVQDIPVADDLCLMAFAERVFEQSDVTGFEGACLAVTRSDLEFAVHQYAELALRRRMPVAVPTRW